METSLRTSPTFTGGVGWFRRHPGTILYHPPLLRNLMGWKLSGKVVRQHISKSRCSGYKRMHEQESSKVIKTNVETMRII